MLEAASFIKLNFFMLSTGRIPRYRAGFCNWWPEIKLNQYQILYRLVSKDISRVGSGYAAGCAAVAVPRRQKLDFVSGLCPWFGWPFEFVAPKAVCGGVAPGTLKGRSTAGRSHRRTSGGEAESRYVQLLPSVTGTAT